MHLTHSLARRAPKSGELEGLCDDISCTGVAWVHDVIAPERLARLRDDADRMVALHAVNDDFGTDPPHRWVFDALRPAAQLPQTSAS